MSLLLAGSGEKFTLQEVADTAQIALGSISFRFGSKDGLIRATLVYALDRLMTEEHIMVQQALAGTRGLEAYVVRYVGDFADFLRTRGPILRVVMRRSGTDKVMADRGRHATRAGAELATTALLEYQDEFGGRRPRVKAETAFHVIFATLARQLGLNTLGTPAHFQDFADVKVELARMTVAYLKSRY